MALWRCNALALMHIGNSFGIRSYEKCARKAYRMCNYKIVGLKVFQNLQLQKMWGGAPKMRLPSCLKAGDVVELEIDSLGGVAEEIARL